MVGSTYQIYYYKFKNIDEFDEIKKEYMDNLNQMPVVKFRKYQKVYSNEIKLANFLIKESSLSSCKLFKKSKLAIDLI